MADDCTRAPTIGMGGYEMVEKPHFWILRLGEMTLKSRPVRRHFQSRMEQDLLDLALRAEIDLHIEHIGSLIIASSHSEVGEVEEVLCHCFGLQSVDRAIPCPPTPGEVANIALETDSRFGEERTFGVATKRTGAKGEWGSQDFSGMVGHHMLEGDGTLSVNLSNPDYPVKVILSKQQAWLLAQKVNCPGGLPIGVQGLVLAKISSEEVMLGAWQLMRRGCRMVVQEHSDEALLAILAGWDSTITDAKKALHSRSGPGRARGEIWGSIGEVDTSEVMKDGKNTPISVLNPMCGWSEEEMVALGEHIRNPTRAKRPSYDNDLLTSWIA